jgi:hypothetical protein
MGHTESGWKWRVRLAEFIPTKEGLAVRICHVYADFV